MPRTPQQNRERVAKYRAANLEKIRAYKRAKRDGTYQRPVRAPLSEEEILRRRKKNAERQREWRKKNPEKYLARLLRYKQKNPNAANERVKRYQARHPDRIRAIWKKYHEREKERLNKISLEYYYKNKEKISARLKETRIKDAARLAVRDKAWRDSNKERIYGYRSRSIGGAKRRAAKRNAEGTYSYQDVVDLFNRQGGKCASCKREISKYPGKKKYHVDHVTPLKLGGSNYPSNLQLLCPRCNCSKGAKSPEQWAQQNGLLFC